MNDNLIILLVVIVGVDSTGDFSRDFSVNDLNSDWTGQYLGGAVIAALYLVGLIFIIYGWRKYSKESKDPYFMSKNHESAELFLDFTYRTEDGAFTVNAMNTKIEKAKLTVLLGESGIGKSCVLETVAGFRESGQVSGTMKFNGKEMIHKPFARATHCSIVSQEDQLRPYFDGFPARDVIRLCVTAKDCDYPMPRNLSGMQEVLDLIELPDAILEREYGMLSNSMRQRVRLAIALTPMRPVLILDMITNGLDQDEADDIVQILRRVSRSLNITVIAALHQPSEKQFIEMDWVVVLELKNKNYSFIGETFDTGELTNQTDEDIHKLLLRCKVNERTSSPYSNESNQATIPIDDLENFSQTSCCRPLSLSRFISEVGFCLFRSIMRQRYSQWFMVWSWLAVLPHALLWLIFYEPRNAYYLMIAMVLGTFLPIVGYTYRWAKYSHGEVMRMKCERKQGYSISSISMITSYTLGAMILSLPRFVLFAYVLCLVCYIPQSEIGDVVTIYLLQIIYLGMFALIVYMALATRAGTRKRTVFVISFRFMVALALLSGFLLPWSIVHFEWAAYLRYLNPYWWLVQCFLPGLYELRGDEKYECQDEPYFDDDRLDIWCVPPKDLLEFMYFNDGKCTEAYAMHWCLWIIGILIALRNSRRAAFLELIKDPMEMQAISSRSKEQNINDRSSLLHP